MLSADAIEKAKSIQTGLSQFELRHLPIKRGDIWECDICGLDFPCSRMLLFMQLQAISALQAMIPSGNMGAVMSRFMGGNDKK